MFVAADRAVDPWDWRVTRVIPGPMAYRDRGVAFLTWLLQRHPPPVVEVEVWTVGFEPAATLQGRPLKARDASG